MEKKWLMARAVPCVAGKRKICYYHFKVQTYNAMGAQCGNCGNSTSTLADCFNPGCIVADGFERSISTVNRKLPGQGIHVCLNDEIVIDLDNQMVGYDVTIHWHGILQIKMPWMDGVPMVTQCPIPTDNVFRYVFNASNAGTHFWHAHTGLERADGLNGMLIVREPNDPHLALYDYDLTEHTLFLNDWIDKRAAEFQPGGKSDAFGPNSFLINGYGCNTNLFTNVSNCDRFPMAAIHVQRNKTYRIRAVNPNVYFCGAELTIENSNFTIIATDGYPVVPRTFQALLFYPGERYDILFKWPAGVTKNELYIRFRALGFCAGFQVFARIIAVQDQNNYTKSFSDHLPHPNPPSYFTEYQPNPLTLNAVPNPNLGITNPVNIDTMEALPTVDLGDDLRDVTPDRRLTLNITKVLANVFPSQFLARANYSFFTTINNIASTDFHAPPLTQHDPSIKFCNAENPTVEPQEGFFFCVHGYELELNEVVEVTVHDVGVLGVVNHPFHLHGHNYNVMEVGTAADFLARNSTGRRLTHRPVVKDTTSVPSAGYIIIRFRATNRGVWPFHCHFEWHFLTGMKVIFGVGKRSQFPPPPYGFPKCGDFKPRVCRLK